MPIEDPSLEITGGPTRADIAAPGSQLHYLGQPQLFDQVGAVVEQVEPMIANINALLIQARQPQGELQVALRNLSASTAHLDQWLSGFLLSEAGVDSLGLRAQARVLGPHLVGDIPGAHPLFML